MEFLGYHRPDGQVGVRNVVLVIPGGMVAARICDFVAGAVTVHSPSNDAAGFSTRDRVTIGKTLIGLGSNANVASVVIIGEDPHGGYPEVHPAYLAEKISATGKPVEIVYLSECDGTLGAISKGIEAARRLVWEASQCRRESAPISSLCLGVKCGHSDPTSGMAGNPVVGHLYDALVEAGGTALFGETTELTGAEHILARRAATEEIAREILKRVRQVEERSLACGEDIRNTNPVPDNIAGGISTLEEKSLGAIYKAGSKPISGVLDYADRPPRQGLYLVDNWMAISSIFTGYAAAGAQINIFQHGGGGQQVNNLILEPSPAVISPTIWTSANRKTLEHCGVSLDFYSGQVIEGKQTIAQAGEALLKLVISTASGMMTRSETIKWEPPAHIYTLDTPF
ncbi:MAG: UxaA family hydrolase [Deltaproteobacteria bacterium]|nr:UxaA family hydrolase [Deltaproteobacteria bacterium]